MFILTASRVLSGKKQKIVMTSAQSLITVDKVMLGYFNDLRPTGVTDVNFEQVTYVSTGSDGTAALTAWPVTLVVKITDTDKDTPRTMVFPATVTLEQNMDAAKTYTQLNTAFQNHQNISINPALNLNDATVFVETIIVNC